MRLLNQTRGTLLADRLKIADSFFCRLRGLLGSHSLPAGEALLIRPCKAVHMFGMRYSIDVAFADQAGQVLKTVAALAPGRLAKCPGAAWVAELPVGTLAATATVPGDVLVVAQAGVE
jgi:hypothetical protein